MLLTVLPQVVLFVGAALPAGPLQNRFPTFDPWFEKYRAGKMLYPPQGLDELLNAGNRPAAEKLLALATFRFHPDPREEKERHATQQPWAVRALALETLGKLRDPETLRWLTTEVLLGKSQRSPAERACAARAIGLSGHQPSLLGLLSALYDESAEVRAAAADAAGRIGGAQASMAIAQRLEDAEAPVRARCVEALAASFDPRDSRFTDADRARIVGAMASRLSDLDWRVRAAACDFFASHPDASALPSLLRALRQEKEGIAGGTGRKRVYFQIADAIVRAGGSAELPTAAVPAYFGIPVRSDRVLFLLDVSGSMQDLIEPALVTGANAPPAPSTKMTKLDWAKQELIAILSRLDSSDRFNVILFETSVYPVFDGTVPATAENVSAAVNRVRAAAGGGGTNLFGALEIGLRIGAPNSSLPFETDADTVFVLSDGTPSTGLLTDPKAILSAVETANALSRIAIHTIDLGPNETVRSDRGGEPGAERLMHDLARRNFGESRRVPGR